MGDRLWQLEGRFERLLLKVQDLQRKLTAAIQQVRNLQMTPVGVSSTGQNICYTDPVAIPAAGNLTGLTVYQLSGGNVITVNSNATVYNVMSSATSATVTSKIVVAPNGDGTYLAVSQGCT